MSTVEKEPTKAEIQILIELYKADWCGHCKSFSPIWEKLPEKLREAAKNVKFEFITYDSETHNNLMVERGISSFPTLTITVDGTKYELKKLNGIEDLISEILKIIQVNQTTIPDPQTFHPQNGGGFYYRKYLKYKQKYLTLRSSV